MTPKYQGYNLAYCSTENVYTYGVTVNITSLNSFYVYGNNTNTKYCGFMFQVNPNTIVRVSFDYDKTNELLSGAEMQLRAFSVPTAGGQGAYISGSYTTYTAEKGNFTYTFNTKDNSEIMFAFYLPGAIAVNESNALYIEKFMITEGTEIRPFEPYVGGI